MQSYNKPVAHSGDITPDNINEVMNTLGIDYDEE